jgi:hypothetical protein
MGLAKKESSARPQIAGLGVDGGLWGVRCGVKPINDRRHFSNVTEYILDHELEGAVVRDRYPNGPPPGVTWV